MFSPVYRPINTYRSDWKIKALGFIEKTYWVSRHMKAQWHLTRPICRAHGFDIVTIDSLDEWGAVASMCEARRKLFGRFVHVGGVAATSKSKTNWYWISTNKRVSYEMPWQKGQPDFSGINEWCLSMSTIDGFKFNDISCHGSWEERFICESVRYLNADISVKVGVVQIEENKNFE